MILESFDIFKKGKDLGLDYSHSKKAWIAVEWFTVLDSMLIDGKLAFKMHESLGSSFVCVKLDSLRTLENFPVNYRNDLELEMLNIETLETLPAENIEDTLYLSFINFKNLNSNLKKVGNKIRIRNCSLPNFKGLENVDCGIITVSECSDLNSFEGLPKNLHKLNMKLCDVESFEGIPKNIKYMTLSKCDKLKSLYGIPKSLLKCNIINCIGISNLERDFVTNNILNKIEYNNYFVELLTFAVNAKREDEISLLNLPEDIKSDLPIILNNVRGISKFNI